MTVVVQDDFDHRWAAWKEKGRLRDIAIQQRMGWLAGIMGMAVVTAAAWLVP